ncbi:MAG: hypothetical protein K0R09_1374 [Clostridiales bacterium]|jgi:uncharacterized Tic20 family protein|nr:hypothetical protein [Clostridiales bacterium]
MLTTEQKILAVVCHACVFLSLGIIVPLIVMLVSKDDYVKTQAKEALIFQLVMVGGFIISLILTIVIIGILGLIFFGIASLVLAIIAIVNVAEGRDYSYPVTGKWARNM